MHWLTDKRVPVSDLHAPLRHARERMSMTGAKENLFWTQDHHLSSAGHREVASALLERHRDLLEGR